MREKNGRSGKHKPTKTLVGGYVDPEVRALAVLVCDKTGETITQMVIDGITSKAIGCGIMKNGEIARQYKAAYKAALEMVHLSIVNKRKGGAA